MNIETIEEIKKWIMYSAERCKWHYDSDSFCMREVQHFLEFDFQFEPKYIKDDMVRRYLKELVECGKLEKSKNRTMDIYYRGPFYRYSIKK